MFSYYGGKSALVDHYPAPAYGTVIEPFCGGAQYAVKYFERDVWINDKYEVVYRIWKYIQQATAADIRRLPELKAGDHIDNFPLNEEEKLLMGFAIHTGGYSPAKTCSIWSTTYSTKSYSALLKERLLRLVGRIDHWKITNLSYFDMENVPGTWFIDPPYQQGGQNYVESGSNIDYDHLRQWCESRRGEIIVCENSDQTWFPIGTAEMVHVTDGIARNVADRYTLEVMWHRGGHPLQDAMDAHPEVNGVHAVCAMVPDQTDEEYRNLRERIKRNGLRRPITLDDNGLILDGRHRLRACYETNTPARFETSNSEPMEFVTDAIAHRSLTTGQRAMIGNDMRKWYDEKARERQHGGVVVNSSQAGKSRDKVGKAVGVGGQAIDRAREIANVDPELAQKVREGGLTLNAAYDRIQPEPVVIPMVKPTALGEVKNAINGVRLGARSLSHNIGDFVARADRLLAQPEFETSAEMQQQIDEMFDFLDGRADNLLKAVMQLYERFSNGPKTD